MSPSVKFCLLRWFLIKEVAITCDMTRNLMFSLIISRGRRNALPEWLKKSYKPEDQRPAKTALEKGTSPSGEVPEER